MKKEYRSFSSKKEFCLSNPLGFAILFVCLQIIFPINLLAQSIEQMWEQLIDSDKVSIKKPAYIEISEDEIVRLYDAEPSFGIYRDNYFITGFPTNEKISKNSADVKFQISIRQRLTKTILPLQTSLMLTYTQKSFWDIYRKSAPFSGNNYNPGLLLVKPLMRNKQLRGIGTFGFEHESNGRDSTFSRSWNYLVLSWMYFYNANFTVQTKIWSSWAGKENRDLYKFRGYGLIALNYRSTNDRFWLSAILNPRDKLKAFNTQLEFNYKPSSNANQYLFVQWYNGFGESLMDYNKYTSMIRFGICIKPPMRNYY